MLLFFFFFQAEDGIRDHCVTGVQTCALPISSDSTPRQILIERGVESLEVADQGSGKSWRGPALRELADDLRRLEELLAVAAPAWAHVPLGKALAAFDGSGFPQHFARIGGPGPFFSRRPRLPPQLSSRSP